MKRIKVSKLPQDRQVGGWCAGAGGSAQGSGSVISEIGEIIFRIVGMETEQLLLRKP